MSRLSIRWRVTLVAVGVLALTIAMMATLGNALLEYRLEADAKNVLRNRAAAQVVTLERDEGSTRVSDPAGDGLLDSQSWIFADGRWVERARASAAVLAEVDRLARVDAPTYRTIGDHLRVYARPIRDGAGRRTGTVIVGQSLRPYENSERLARVGTGLFSLVALLAGAAAIYWSIGRALAPVDEMTRRASHWSEHDLHRRFGLGAPHDEITALAATLDSLLVRIDAAMQREQRITAEIAHELRTPLAGVRAEAELGLREADGEAAQTLERIVASADRMNRAIETLLAAHRGATPAGRSCDPVDAAEAAVEAFRRSCPDKHWNVLGSPGDARVEVDESVLVQTLGPLLDNAARHAAGEIAVSVAREGPRVAITVADDGPGLNGQSPLEIFDAGVSGGERAGLGLPLARRLAQSFGAELEASPSTSGGRFTLTMPGRRPV
jgi:signal transduction histidine kinase